VTPQRQLDAFLAKYSPEIRARGKASIAKMRKRLPGAVQLVYDNYNALVVGFGPSERASEAIFSIALYPRWVTLFFLRGAGLPDPQKVLRGGGKIVRNVRLDDAADLDKPVIRALIDVALARAEKPIDTSQRGRLVIRSISEKQRPRRGLH